MRRLCLAFLSLLLLNAAFALQLEKPSLNKVEFLEAAKHAPLQLVKNGELQFAIVYDPETETSTKFAVRKSGNLAAEALKDAFERSVGKVPVVLPPNSPELAKYPLLIAVGDTPYSKALGIVPGKLPCEGYVLRTFDKGVVICGNDGSLVPGTYNTMDWYRYRMNGTANGAYDFCERVLGMRYYYAGIGTVAQPFKDLELQACAWTDHPRYKERYNWAVEGMFKRNFPWKGVAKNNNMQIEHSWRMAISTRYISGHSPDPMAMAKVFPDKIDDIFFTDEAGHRYFLPNTHIGNYFDVTNPAFTKLLVDCFVKFYESNGKWRAPWGRQHAPNSEYVLFGQCDTFVNNLENERSRPYIFKAKEGGPRTGKYSDVYMHFWIDLAHQMEERLPGKKIGFSLYHNYSYPPVKTYENVPKNLCPKLDIGTPALVRSPLARKSYVDVYSRWCKVFGKPINAYWYGIQTNAYSKGIQGAYMKELLQLLKPYISDEGLMLDAGGCDWHFYYSYYPVYRAMWNPDCDTDAMIDEHWELLYGPVAGKHLREFYNLVRERWEKVLIPSLTSLAATSVPPSNLYNAYNLTIVKQLEELLDKAYKATAEGSIERLRLDFFAEPWKKEFVASRAYLTKVLNTYRAYRLPEGVEPVIDGKVDEACWELAADMPLRDYQGNDRVSARKQEVRILWNDKGIWLSCKEDGKTSSVPLDVWMKSDHVELFLSPGRGKEEFFHFASNPNGDSAQGSRRLKPIEAGYDGKWRCPGFKSASHLGENGWSTEMFIPFDGLNGKPVPRPYRSWFFNVIVTDAETATSPRLGNAFSINMGNNHNIELFALLKFMGKGDEK